MALTASTIRSNQRKATGLEFQVVNGEVLYNGSLVGFNNFNHATSGDIGRIEAATGEANQIPIGFCHGNRGEGAGYEATADGVTGNTSPSSGRPVPSTSVSFESTIFDVAVTGAVDRTDSGKLVYFTDDNTFTLTPPTRPVPVGFTLRHVSGSSNAVMSVLFFSTETILTQGLAGGGEETIHVGYIDFGNLISGDTDANDVLLRFKMPFHCLLVSGYAQTVKSSAHSFSIIAKWSLAATMEDSATQGAAPSGGTFTDVTGGEITFVSTDAEGSNKGGAAITALNVIHAGQELRLRVKTQTSFTDPPNQTQTASYVQGVQRAVGSYNVYAIVRKLPGA